MTENCNPRVSVCIPTYNHAHFLKDAVESVLCQTLVDFELVVVDNCSTDNTRELVTFYTSRDARVKYFCNDVNVGPQENLNRCLQHASGEFVKILCADDLLEPACLEESVSALENRPEAKLAASARLLVDADLKPIRVAGYSDRNVVVDGHEMINFSLFNGNYIGEPSAVLFRKRDASRGFNSGCRLLIDLEMWLHLLERGPLCYIAAPLCKFRQHTDQETKNAINSLDFIDEEMALYKKYINESYVRASVLNRLKWKLKLAWMMPLSDMAAISGDALLGKIKGYEGKRLLYLIFILRILLSRIVSRKGSL